MVTPSTTPSKKFVLWVAFCCRFFKGKPERNWMFPVNGQDFLEPTLSHLDPFFAVWPINIGIL